MKSVVPIFAHEPETNRPMPTRTLWEEEYPIRQIRCTPASDTEFWDELRSGQWRQLVPEVAYRPEAFDALPVWERARALAAAQALTLDRAVVCGLSAARLWNLWVLPVRDPWVEVNTFGRTRAQSRRQQHSHQRVRSAALSADEVIVANGARFTSLSRTLADVARFHGVMAGVVAIDSVRAAFPALNAERLQRALVERKRPYHGVGLVQEALRLSTGKSESPLESQARYLLLTCDLNLRVAFQSNIDTPAGTYRADFLINGWLVVEIDGRAKHVPEAESESVREILRKERERQVHLQQRGFHILRVHSEDVASLPQLVAKHLALREVRLA